MVIKELNIRFLHNLEITERDIKEIIKIKQSYWKYAFEEHKRWMRENLNDEDYHLLVMNGNDLIGYLNIVQLDILIDGEKTSAYGIGNVCIYDQYSKQGVGTLMLHVLNFYLNKQTYPSMLLCKEQLVKFYSASGWMIYQGNVRLEGHDFTDVLMTNKKIESCNIELLKGF